MVVSFFKVVFFRKNIEVCQTCNIRLGGGLVVFTHVISTYTIVNNKMIVKNSGRGYLPSHKHLDIGEELGPGAVRGPTTATALAWPTHYSRTGRPSIERGSDD